MYLSLTAFYCLIAITCALFAAAVLSKRFPGDVLAYFVVAIVGAWMGGTLFLPSGMVVAGMSVAAAVLGACLLIAVDYRINCYIDRIERMDNNATESPPDSEGIGARAAASRELALQA